MGVVAILLRAMALFLLLVAAFGCAGSDHERREPIGSVARQQTSSLPVRQELTGPELAAFDLTRNVPRSIERACEKLARRSARLGVKRTVFCPPVVPTSRPQKVELAGGAKRYRDLTDGYQVGLYTPGVAAIAGSHWTFGAGTADAFYVYLHITGPIVNATFWIR